MQARDIILPLLFVAFGAVNQWIKKKKANADARSRNSTPQRPAQGPLRQAETPRAPQETTVRAPVPVRPPVAQPAPEKDWDEEPDEDSDENEQQARPAAPTPQAGERAKAAGKDSLSQLARELGLEIPTAPAPQRPSNTSATPASRPAAPARPVPAARLESHIESELLAFRAPAPMTEAQPEAAGLNMAVLGLSDPEGLRRAVILKTIFDPPLSLRPRRGVRD